jgi:hypothetical protein
MDADLNELKQKHVLIKQVRFLFIDIYIWTTIFGILICKEKESSVVNQEFVQKHLGYFRFLISF